MNVNGTQKINLQIKDLHNFILFEQIINLRVKWKHKDTK